MYHLTVWEHMAIQVEATASLSLLPLTDVNSRCVSMGAFGGNNYKNYSKEIPENSIYLGEE